MEAPVSKDTTAGRTWATERTWLVDLEALHKRTGLGPHTLIAEALIAIAERLEMVFLDQEAEIYRHLALVEADIQKLWAIVEAPTTCQPLEDLE